MKIFTCPSCGGPLYFDNLRCVCGADIAFDPEPQRFVAAEAHCVNRPAIGCNWIAEDEDGHCRSCRMSEVVPHHDVSDNLAHWSEAEAAKRWLLANLGRWGWFANSDQGRRPVFHMLSDETREGFVDVIMGHADGVITIDVTEADDVEIVRRREQFDEAQRTMIGHMRHEMAHFLYLRIFDAEEELKGFRAAFGDERADYAEALKRYYEEGPKDGWAGTHISAYATSHPHEDWAESCAHVLHLTDIVDSFCAAGLRSAITPQGGYDAYAETDPERLISIGVEIGLALNHVNRSMGVSDIYPFVHTPEIRAKLVFVHAALAEGRPRTDAGFLARLRRLFGR